MSQDINILDQSSGNEKEVREDLFNLYQKNPLPANEVLSNLGVFQSRQSLSRIFFMQELYQRILNVHGVIMEFGVRWGRDLALFQALRGMYEPYNYTRKIIGFDTFEGFPNVHEKDADSDVIQVGAYGVSENYEAYLEKILAAHAQNNPIPHIKKFELIKGDASVTLDQYLKDHPETVVAFAYFDMDIYSPTKNCLEKLLPYVTKGSIIGFDELNHAKFPGETIALREVLGTANYRIQRLPINSFPSFIVFE